jgi:hypothetical protein
MTVSPRQTAHSVASVFCTFVLGGCNDAQPVRLDATLHNTHVVGSDVVSVQWVDASVDASQDGGIADIRTWPFVEHAQHWCLPDRLANTEYLSRWVELWNGRVRPGEPVPTANRLLPHVSGRNPPTMDDHHQLLSWQTSPRTSHVMDCTLPVTRQGTDTVHGTSYTIYLPTDYLNHPERPRPVLLLVSGGNGNRTRWFLTPTRSKGIIPATGGMEVRRRVDEWVIAHPDRAPPLVVGLDGTSGQFPNGMHTFIAQELQQHVLATYLPTLRRDDIAWGVDSISSGAVEVARAFHQWNNAFDSVGFLSPFVDQQALNIDVTFGTLAQRSELFRGFAARRREGLFAMRFSIGDQDSHYPDTWRFYLALVAEGMFPQPERRTYTNCVPPNRPPARSRCASTWAGFYLYPNEFHNYHALIPSWPSQFEWDLNTLADIQLHKHAVRE